MSVRVDADPAGNLSVAATSWFCLYALAIIHLRNARHERRQRFTQQVDEALGSAAKDHLNLRERKSQLEDEIATRQQELREVDQLLSGDRGAIANEIRKYRADVDSFGSALHALTGPRATTITFVLGIVGGIIANELGHWMGLP